MRVLGIDQSFTNTGVTVVDDGILLHHEVISTKADSTNDMADFLRAQFIKNELIRIADTYLIEKIRIEGLAMGNTRGNTARKLGGLQFAIMIALFDSGYTDIEVIPPTTLKKSATGKGNADKEEMFDALPETIKETFGSIPKTRGRYDLTDAYFLSTYG